ncbi:UNVERIFIED_CONTAM: hypothetical protein Slati_3969200 [Sesamum latifolium]|uniref:Retrotransposon gag protein n=1 Tax=Sesamum latifolium TaxID=2727402 RepID=A0AAW2TPW1_9LAMI
MPLEDIVKTLALSTQQFQQETRFQNLESQVSQLASSVSRLESQGKLPSQTIINPKQNVSAITLCSEKELQFKNSTRRGHALQNRTENSVVRGHAEQGKIGEELENSPKQAEKSNQIGEEHPKVFVPKPPFPERFFKSKKEKEEKDILETLRKVEVNIPLLDAIKQIPRYAKFLKEMYTNKSKLKGNAMFDGGGASKLIKNKSPTSSPRTYKNKAFHEKISSRKKSSMDRQVLLNPHHHRVHYIEDVDLEHPTHLS